MKKVLDALARIPLEETLQCHKNHTIRGLTPMISSFFDFSKKRSRKEAALFCVFHGALVASVTAILTWLGG